MVAVYRRLIRLYPSSFRARFGEELLQFVRDEAAHGRRIPWTRTYADLFRSASVQRWKEQAMKPKLGIGLAVLLIMFAVTRVVTGSGFNGRTALIMGIELGIVGLLVALGALVGRYVRGAEYDYSRRRLRWWWILAGLSGATEATVGVGQLISDPKPENVFALFILAAFAALVFGGMAVRNRTIGNYMIVGGVLPMLPAYWLIVPTIVALVVIVNALADNFRIAQPRPAT